MFFARTLRILGIVSFCFASMSCANKKVLLKPLQSQENTPENQNDSRKPPEDPKPSVVVENPINPKESVDQKAGQPAAKSEGIIFRFPSIIVRPGESISLLEMLNRPSSAVSNVEFGLIPIVELPNADLGTLDKTGIYKAPSALSQELRIKVFVMGKDNPEQKSQMTLILAPLDKFFFKDDASVSGIHGEIFLTPDLKMLPDFSKLVVHEKIVVPDLNFLIGNAKDLKVTNIIKNITDAFQVQDRFYKNNPKLVDGFSLRFSGRILIEKAGMYSFSLVSDDGARLYINDKLVTEDNRNKNMSPSKSGEIALTPGECTFRVEYFNGNSKLIPALGLILQWKTPTSDKEVVVPRDRFR